MGHVTSVALCVYFCWQLTTFPVIPGGDIFIHAKSNNYSKLYELTQAVVRSFPAGTVQKAEDVYGWTYQEGRDLSGFIDGEEGVGRDGSQSRGYSQWLNGWELHGRGREGGEREG